MNDSGREVRVGILGTARVATYAVITPARDMAGLTVAAIGSRDVRRAEEFATLHRIEKATTYEGVITDPAIEAIYIALPNSMHSEWCLKALAAGKAVLCEKPLTSNAAEAARCVGAALTADRPLVEAFHWRFHPVADRITQIVASHILGPIKNVTVRFSYPLGSLEDADFRFSYSAGGGILMDAGCYCINFLRLVLGEPIAVLGAQARLRAPQVDVAMTASLRFKNGAVGHLSVSNDVPGNEMDIGCDIEGAAGHVSISNLFLPQLGGALTIDANQERTVERLDTTPSYWFQAKRFADVVRGVQSSPFDARDAIANMTAIDLVYRAAGLRPRGEANFC